MSNSMTSKLRGMLAGFVAIVAALLLVPGTAFAATWTGDQEATITINGVSEGDTVEVFEVATINLNRTTNETSYSANTTNFTQNSVDTYLKSDGSASDAAALVSGMRETASAVYNGIVQEGSTSVTTGNLPAGVYYIRITPAKDASYVYQPMVVKLEPAAGTGTSWTIDNVAATAKKTTSTVTKKVYDSNGKEVNTASLGEELTFGVSFNIGQGLDDFVVTDTMTGFEYTENSLKVYVGNSVTGTEVDTSNYTLRWDSQSHKLTVNFADDFLESINADTEYYIEYKAVVCKHAASSGATNKVETTTGGSSTVTIDFGKAGVFKFEKGDKSKALSDAVFQLVDKDGNAITDVNGDNVYIVTSSDGYGWTNANRCNHDGTVNDDGYDDVLLAIGDTVYFKEIVAPSGYVLSDGLASATVIGLDESVGGYAEVANTPSDSDQGINLPTTGGTGTIIFTAVGVVIIAGAVAYIVRSRKQN